MRFEQRAPSGARSREPSGDRPRASRGSRTSRIRHGSRVSPWLAVVVAASLPIASRAAAAPPGASAGGAAPTSTASAAAAPKAPPKPADKRAAQKLLAQGNQLVGEGDYLGALEKFRSAYDKFPSPKILLNIGTTLRQLGRNVEAAQIYESYLADAERDPAREKDVKRVLDEIDAVVGRILVTVDDPTATLRLDGKQIDPFAKGESRRVEPGEHTLMAEKPGAPPAIQSIVVKPRQEHFVTLRFTPPPPPPPPPVQNTQRTLGLALGGVGAVTLVAGIVVGFVAIGQSSAASARCYDGGVACDAEGIELDQSAKTSATISTVGFAVGGGVLAAGALIWLVSPQPTKEPAPAAPAAPTARWLAVRPIVGGATLGIGGAF